MDRFDNQFDDFVSKTEAHQYEIERLRSIERLPEGHVMVDGSVKYESNRKFIFRNDCHF